MKKLVTFLLVIVLTTMLSANNITISNLSITGKNTISQYSLVQFDISWENSWRTSSASSNWDAAWVFVKYRVPVLSGGDGLWKHAWLNDAGHTTPDGSTIDIGLLTPGTTFNTTTNPGLGAFIYRNADGTGTFTKTGVQLRWNYGANNVTDNAVIDIQVYAIEMVYVPQGAFALGDGNGGSSSGLAERAYFYLYPTTTNTYPVSTETAITVGTTSGNIYYLTSTYGGDRSGPIPADFPKGYNAFYCMKYEISQQEYVDFLNSLTYTQQATRTANAPSSGAGTAAIVNSERNGIDIQTPGVNSGTPAVYACNLNGNGSYGESMDGQWIACNQITWADLAAYLDWSGLRPMTELEYEKACRGTLTAVAGEYAWGTTDIAGSAYTLNNSGTSNEVIATGYSTNGNALINATIGSIGGPLRVGVFATSSSTRITAGATYYGIMEMTGNLWERTITVGAAGGRSFTGIHGNGALATNGNADASTWPGIDAVGSGWRGGGINSSYYQPKVSDRCSAALADPGNNGNCGGRGVRAAPITYFIGQSYGGGIIFYIDVTGQHGLIAATGDLNTDADWGCNGTSVSGADGTAIGTGNQNTIDIMADCSTAGIAARLCGDLVSGGYSDWYLPSKDELNQMYLQKDVIGGFVYSDYWSSSEYDATTAWYQEFLNTNNLQYYGIKDKRLLVRAVRSF